MVNFEVLAVDGAARRGVLRTPHGSAATPGFMAVATRGALKGVTAGQARDLGQELLLANTYHLALRPGGETVRELGGLHAFCGWSGPLLTDSGGYQVYSLATQRTIDERGVSFRSHLDGTPFFLGPEESIACQRRLGADVIMAFDECPSATAETAAHRAGVERTLRWLDRSIAAWCEDGDDLPGGSATQALFGIVQGGPDPELRRRSLTETVARDLPGYALGGLAVGEDPADRRRIVAACAPDLPPERPRYLMGIGTPPDIVDAVCCGMDLFDCVLPTRMGRHGIAYTDAGPLHLKRAAYAADDAELDPATPSEASGLPRGYLRHLLKAGEPLGGQLLSLHNLAYYQRLLRRLREAIDAGALATLAEGFLARYDAGGETTRGDCGT